MPNCYFHSHLHEVLVLRFDGFQRIALGTAEDSAVYVGVNERAEEINCRPPEMPWSEICDQSAKRLSSSPERAYMHTTRFRMLAVSLHR